MRLAVEVDDLAAVSRTMYSEVADPLDVAVGRLVDTLFSCGAMAGSDQAGTAWSASYDPAARATLQAVVAAANGCYRLSAMFAQTARNYANADSASTASARRAIAADVAGLPAPTAVSFPTLPSALGGSGGGPPGWGLVQAAVGYAWPNGHQDRLHRAADAWSACAAALPESSSSALFAPIRCFVDGLPEYDDMHTVCTAMCQHLRDLASACRSLAQACRDLAQHIDEVHSEIEHQLFELGGETLGIQVLGGILAVFTAGAAEAPTQGLQASRIVAVGDEIGQLITKFIALAKDAIADLPTVQAAVERVSLILEQLQLRKLAVAGVTPVPNLPGSVRTSPLATPAEARAYARIADQAAGVPEKLVGRQTGDPGVWGDRRSLQDHFRRHGRDFSANSEADYASKGSDFLVRAIREKLPRKIDKMGVIRIFDPDTNSFGSYAPNGATKTFYKVRGPSYFDRQPGVLQ